MNCHRKTRPSVLTAIVLAWPATFSHEPQERRVLIRQNLPTDGFSLHLKKNFLIVSPGHDDYFESDRIIAQIPLCGGVEVPANAINLKKVSGLIAGSGVF